MPSLLMRVSGESPKRQESLEKTGHLAKLGGKLKTWRKRWFVLKNGVLTYWKSQNDVNRKPQGQIILDEVCRYVFVRKIYKLLFSNINKFNICFLPRTYRSNSEYLAGLIELKVPPLLKLPLVRRLIT